MISGWFQLFAETQILCMSLPRVMVCAPLLPAPHGCILMKEKQTITVIRLVQWKQQIKFRIIKKASSDYSLHFRCCSFVVAVCSLLTIVVCSCS
jgi:hypothetical protein